MARAFPVLLLVMNSVHTMIKANQSHTTLKPHKSHSWQESHPMKAHKSHTLKPNLPRVNVSGMRVGPTDGDPFKPRRGANNAYNKFIHQFGTKEAASEERDDGTKPRNQTNQKQEKRPRKHLKWFKNRSEDNKRPGARTTKPHKSHRLNESDTSEMHESRISNKDRSLKVNKSHTLEGHAHNNSTESRRLQAGGSGEPKFLSSNQFHILKKPKSRKSNESHTTQEIEILRASRSHEKYKMRMVYESDILESNETESDERDMAKCDYVNSDKFEMDIIKNWNESVIPKKFFYDVLGTTEQIFSNYESPLQTILRNKSREFNQTFPGVDQDPTSYDRKLYKMHQKYLDRVLRLMDRFKAEGHQFPGAMDLVADEALNFWLTNTSHIHNATALANLDKVPLPVEVYDKVSERALAEKAIRILSKLEGKEAGWENVTMNPNITLDPEWGTLESEEPIDLSFLD